MMAEQARGIRVKRWHVGVILIVLLWLLPAATSAQGTDENIVASTSWTAALARAAGASNVVTLAPGTRQNPADYALTAANQEQLAAATWVIYDGDETFAAEIETMVPAARRIQVATTNTPTTILQDTARIATALGTEATQAEWASHFNGIAARIKAEINAVYGPDTTVVVHPSLKEVATWLQFDIVGEMTAELSSAEIEALAKQGPTLIIDSYHEPSGSALADAADALQVAFINYPGVDGTEAIEDVLRYNLDQLVSYGPIAETRSTADKMLPWLIAAAGALILFLVLSILLLRRLNHR